MGWKRRPDLFTAASDMFLELEDELGISIVDKDTEQLGTFGQFHEYLLVRLADPSARRPRRQVPPNLSLLDEIRHLLGIGCKQSVETAEPEPPPEPLSREDVWETLKKVAVRVTKIDPALVQPDTRFVDVYED